MSESELNQNPVQGINGFWVQARAEWESERASLQSQVKDYEAAWKAQANESAMLKAAITQMLTYLSGDNFRSQQMAHARNVGEKALKGRYTV